MDPLNTTPDQKPRGGVLGHFSMYPDILIARIVGIVCIALGFIIGIHGLDHPNTAWLQTALGLIVTGLLAQSYALIRTMTRPNKPDPLNKEP